MFCAFLSVSGCRSAPGPLLRPCDRSVSLPGCQWLSSFTLPSTPPGRERTALANASVLVSEARSKQAPVAAERHLPLRLGAGRGRRKHQANRPDSLHSDQGLTSPAHRAAERGDESRFEPSSNEGTPGNQSEGTQAPGDRPNGHSGAGVSTDLCDTTRRFHQPISRKSVITFVESTRRCATRTAQPPYISLCFSLLLGAFPSKVEYRRIFADFVSRSGCH